MSNISDSDSNSTPQSPPERTGGWGAHVHDQVEARARFERFVADAIDSLPEEFAARLNNVAIVVEDGELGGPLLGLYQGIDQTRRTNAYAGVLPDVITIYRLPLERYSRSEAELARNVRTTVIHEIAHHFGISDERLHDLGWG